MEKATTTKEMLGIVHVDILKELKSLHTEIVKLNSITQSISDRLDSFEARLDRLSDTEARNNLEQERVMRKDLANLKDEVKHIIESKTKDKAEISGLGALVATVVSIIVNSIGK